MATSSQKIVATRRVRHRSSGAALIYVTLSMVVMFAFASLAVDVGVVRLTKVELQRAADDAALYGVAVLPDSATAISRAMSSAADNQAYGQPVVLQSGDVTTGNWNSTTRIFTANATPLNALQVCAVRTADRQDAVPLSFARILGMSTCDVHTTAVATVTPAEDPYGLAGLDYFSSQGLLTVDSFPSNQHADIVSNGDVKLNILGLVGLTCIYGNVHPGQGKNIYYPALLPGITTHICGSTANSTTSLNYPAVDAGNAATVNNNATIPGCCSNGNFVGAVATHLCGGTYYFNDFTLAANLVLYVDAPTTIYITGKTTLLGSIVVASGCASDLKIRVTDNQPVDLVANLATYCDLYAPAAPINVTAGLGYYGRLIGKNINVLATSFMHVDESLVEANSVAVPSLVK